MAEVQSFKAAGILTGPKFTGPAALIAAMLLVTGCQHQQVVENLPAPNFAGPTVLQPPAPPVAQRPAPQPSAPVQPKPEPPQIAKSPAGIPRDWIPGARAEKREWDYIVIHHSASPAWSLAVIDREHKEKGWDGCGYHFVIGNGTNSSDGKVEPSYRWQVQKWGAHAKTADNQFNEHGIGICLVGNFDIDRPTPAQMQSMTKLVAYLMRTYHVPQSHVLGHRETKPTDCPGRNVNIASLRRTVGQMASGDGAIEAAADTSGIAAGDASDELLLDQAAATR